MDPSSAQLGRTLVPEVASNVRIRSRALRSERSRGGERAQR